MQWPHYIFHRKREPNVWLGVASGALAGLAGTIIMTQFQSAMSAMARPKPKPDEKEETGDNATVKTAQALTKLATGHGIDNNSNKKMAGQIVHYSFGTAMGAVYGAMAEIQPTSSSAMGLPFGAALWLAADEVAVPSLGLSGPPTSTPIRVHAYGLASHLIYGASTELCRKGFRRLLVGHV
jgi:putative membrane protein